MLMVKTFITFVMSPGTQYYLDGGESDLRDKGLVGMDY